MTLLVVLASALLLQPVLDADATVRLASSDTDGADVTWYLDGDPVAVTSGNATTIRLSAGAHDVWATTDYDGTWRALVRPDQTTGVGDMGYVQGWSAVHEDAPSGGGSFVVPSILGLAGIATAVVGRMRPKRP